MSKTPDAILESLSASGLVSEDDLRAVAASSPGPTDAQSCLDLLVRRGTLTPFQAQAVLAGKEKSLVFGEYIVLDRIGAGGMGEVFKAIHKRMDRVVAVKRLPHSAMHTPGAVERFYREVKAAAKLTHPNIVAAYDAGEAQGSHFLVMEFVAGQDLGQLLAANGPLPLGRAIDIIRQAAIGLAYAHGKGVIHRDIKPGNILIAADEQSADGTVKLLDMGLARVHQAGSALGESSAGDEAASPAAGPELTLTQEGRLMGTVEYMSPEQAADAHSADARSDVYSLGCTLYRCLTGKLPYSGNTAVQKIMAHSTAPIPLLVSQRPDVPEELEAVYLKMVAKNPADRYQTMSDVVAALDKAAKAIARAAAKPRNAPAPPTDPPAKVVTDPARVPVARSKRVAAAPPAPQPAAIKTPADNKRRWRGIAGTVLALLVVALVVVRLRGRPALGPDDPKRTPIVATDGKDKAGSNTPGFVHTVKDKDGKAVVAGGADGEIDLLKTTPRIDPDGVLRVGTRGGGGGAPRFFEADVPPEYILELDLKRLPDSRHTEIALVMAGRSFTAQLSDNADGSDGGKQATGLNRLDGRPPREGDGEAAPTLRDNQVERVICEVRANSVKVTLNGTPVIQWSGNPTRLSPGFQLEKSVERRGSQLGIIQWGGMVHCSRATLRPIKPEPAKSEPTKP